MISPVSMPSRPRMPLSLHDRPPSRTYDSSIADDINETIFPSRVIFYMWYYLVSLSCYDAFGVTSAVTFNANAANSHSLIYWSLFLSSSLATGSLRVSITNNGIANG